MRQRLRHAACPAVLGNPPLLATTTRSFSLTSPVLKLQPVGSRAAQFGMSTDMDDLDGMGGGNSASSASAFPTFDTRKSTEGASAGNREILKAHSRTPPMRRGVDRHLLPELVMDGDTSDITRALDEQHDLVEEDGAMGEENPYSHIVVSRDTPPESSPLSLDITMKQLRDKFHDYEGRRCQLCNEAIDRWAIHQNFVPHTGREAILLELLRPFCGEPDDILGMWWYRLDRSKQFRRIRELSDADSRKRRRKLLYLLRFLKEKRILRECFDVFRTDAQDRAAGRSWEFERLEWLGDNVVKYVFNTRMNVVFPVREGGVKFRLAMMQSLIDGNDGLARAYDYLNLQSLTNSDRIVSKFKSDVVEAIFGELQVYLWSTEIDDGIETTPFPLIPTAVPLRRLVWHVMEELAHTMFMMHMEFVKGRLMRVIDMHDLRFIRADPDLRGDVSKMSAKKAAAYAQRMTFSMAPTASPTNRGMSIGSVSLHHRVEPLGGFVNKSGSAATRDPHAYLPQLGDKEWSEEYVEAFCQHKGTSQDIDVVSHLPPLETAAKVSSPGGIVPELQHLAAALEL